MDYEGSNKFTELSNAMSIDTTRSHHIGISNQEFLLQGSILDTGVEILIHRLRGLCDNVDIGPEPFHDHEISYILVSSTPTGTQPLSLRVRRSMNDQSSPWQLRYLGNPEIGDKSRATVVRNILDIPVGADIVDFLKELGFRRDFDYVSKGYIFRKGRIKILVGKLFRYDGTKTPPDLEKVTDSHYVEMSVVAPTGQDAVGDDMRIMADLLKPLIVLDKIDYTRRT